MNSVYSADYERTVHNLYIYIYIYICYRKMVNLGIS